MKPEFPSLTSAQGDPVGLLSVQADGHLDGLLLSMTLRQVFRNDGMANVELSYTFPLAWGAVLLGLHATIAGRRLAGQVMARGEARERYEQAVEQGDAPILVEQAQGGVYSASLGSLQPGEEAVIELAYAQLLAYEQGRIRLIVPTTIAPRYGDAVAQGGLQPDQVADADLLAQHGFGLAVTLTGAVAQARVGSPTHAISQQREADSVRVALQGQAWLDRDFVLLLEGLEGRSFAIAGPDTRSGEGHTAVIVSDCPALPAAAPAPLRLKILVDCSGSMAGQSIEQAREALRPLARLLVPEDQVSFSRFGSAPQRVLKPVAASPRNLAALLEAIDGTEADLGGTEMEEALTDTFALAMGAATTTGEADVLLITDGEVWGAQGIVDEARRSGHRVYALGVGSAPAESLLREMAEATGGACEFATPHEDMAQAIGRLLARLRLTVSVEAHLETAGRPLWSSALPRRLAAGETVHLFLRLPAQPAQAPALQLAGQVAPSTVLTIRSDDLVARLVAAREIRSTADKTQAGALAERYQLVTEHTNLLLVFERAEADKTDGMPALHQVRPMLAAGWAGSGRLRPPGSRRDVSMQGLRFSMRSLSPVMARELFDPPTGPFLNTIVRANSTEAQDGDATPADWGIDDSDLPAFLRRQTEPVPMPVQIILAFNQAVALGQPFRPALRAVTGLPLPSSLCQAILEAAQHVGGPLKAWACYLLWLHEFSTQTERLSDEALALVRAQMSGLALVRRAAAAALFHDQLKVGPANAVP